MDVGTARPSTVLDTAVTTVKRRARVRAPELVGRGWLNTGGTTVSLKDLRGKVVLLDFWTFCCINCLHVLDELRPLEKEFEDILVTIGVHSPKFVHEADPDALAAAVERYEVHHPVLDDPELTTWQNYAVKAWPTLVLVDPEGYVVHVAAGEGHVEALRTIIGELVAEHDAKGTLHRGSGPYQAPEPASTTLRFPAKAVVTPSGTILVSDSAHHSIVELEADGETVVRRIGTGERGRQDGTSPTFSEPAGLALVPNTHGYDVVIADTVNHLLRGLDLTTGEVTTIAGTGEQWRDGETDGPADKIELTSPWDVAWWNGGVAIAMAGNHTLGFFDPAAGTVRRLAGTTVEGINDGPAEGAFFAQTSGLAADGDRLWMVDSETSALRYLEHGEVHTVIGKGLFAFGHKDGDADEALLQHPLGVTVLDDHSVVISDTYNNAVRRYDPAARTLTTIATDVAEPSDALLVDGELVVVASAAHRLERFAASATRIDGAAHEVKRPSTDIASGAFELAVVFTPPTGTKLDERYGPSTRLEITSSPPELILEGAGVSTELVRALRINDQVTNGVLHVVAQAASCSDDPADEHPVCRLTRQDWGVPVRVVADAPTRLPLLMGGMDEGAGQAT
ncbi:NHL domain-containing thioredoxin family protein [Lentzea jiangxiensis]|uniref:Thiol-disulfide isomerase or thioredoxin n=1 Tax=Lentzea jiangxiensis TaxID=641025 RepID=A0A1H0WMN9_9PSEU|nr:NHL domain-containing thioredoxin family protein [Lentzea jiangxiensis]SDP91831.1 Thiol-disulfide isomerase or thioredoxin [Lentzea jiangxiensis]